MVISVNYPRRCLQCNSIFAHSSGYSRHKSNGTCKKRAAQPICITQTLDHENDDVDDYDTTTEVDTALKLRMQLKKSEALRKVQEQTQKLALEEMQRKLEDMEIEKAQYKLLCEMDSKLPLSSGEVIYIIRTRHALDANLRIYKVGYSKVFLNRAKQYPKGAQVLFVIAADKARDLERTLHDALQNGGCKGIKSRPDCGAEYYEGDIYKLLDYVTAAAKKHQHQQEQHF